MAFFAKTEIQEKKKKTRSCITLSYGRVIVRLFIILLGLYWFLFYWYARFGFLDGLFLMLGFNCWLLGSLGGGASGELSLLCHGEIQRRSELGLGFEGD